MAWVVDTCLLIDVAEADPRFGIPSARLLDRQWPDGLLICPVSDVELAPVFNADDSLQEQFLHSLAASFHHGCQAAGESGGGPPQSKTLTRRSRRFRRRVSVLDCASPLALFPAPTRGRFIFTRNEADFRQLFPTLKVLTP